MWNWITGVVSDVGDWLGSGIASLVEWLLGGIETVVAKVVNAATGFFDVLDSIWNFAVGFMESVLTLLSTLLPFIPEPVSAALTLAFFAVLIAGIVKKVRG